MRSPRLPSARALAVAVAAAVALLGGVLPYATGSWSRLESDTLDARFSVRGAMAAPSDVVIVAIDDRTFSALGLQWPFPRHLHADIITRLRDDGARAIAYDVQFTEPSPRRADDLALYAAVARARHVVLATTVVDAAGQADVLGGAANLRAAHAVAAAANLPADGGGIIRRYSRSMLGLQSFAAATARAAGHAVAAARFAHGSSLIDFRGPPGTIRTVSFSDVLAGTVPAATFAGKVVVVGASSPTLQDLHVTSTTAAQPMAGAEVQANAIWTALHGNPLAPAPGWITVVAIVLCALAAPLVSLRRSVAGSVLVAVAVAAGYLLIAQLAFDSGTVLVVSYPLIAWALGTVGTLAAAVTAALAERNLFSRRLRDSQLELIQRLASAVDSRDAETGEHTYRIGVLCRRLALEIGWRAHEAQILMYASIAHDIGKIGIADSILLKAGPLDAEEWERMKSHTAIGAQLLAGSPNPLMQMAETIARSHHERWDGHGYPDGLCATEIPLVARICAVVDVYDALLSRRSYKEAWRIDDVLAEIERGSGTHFDPELVTAFMRLAPKLDTELRASFTRERGSLALSPMAV